MKTTIDIPDKVLKEAMRNTRAETKRDAVVRAMEEYNRLVRLSRVADMLGKSDSFMSHEELLAARDAEKKRSY